MQVTVEVTQDDIDKGAFRSCAKCPIARATKRLVKRTCKLDVRSRVMALTLSGPRTLMYEAVTLPDAAHEFVVAFDNSEPVSPFSFPLDIPTEYLRQPTGAA